VPAVSEAQRRLMEGIAHGTIPPRGGLTKKKAQEFIDATPKGKKLPARVKPKKRK
jgi:hypothetical protein